MRIAWLVAWREVSTTVFTWTFLLVNLALPLLPLVVALVLSIPQLLGATGSGGAASAPAGDVVIVDHSEHGLGMGLGPYLVRKDLVVRDVTSSTDTAPLDARVQEKELTGWIELDVSSVTAGDWVWHGHGDPPRWLELEVRNALRLAVVDELVGTPEVSALLTRLRDGGDVRVVKVPELDATGTPPQGPTFAALAMILGMMFSGSWVGSRVVQEQQKGLIDQLICTVPPHTLVVGKAVAATVITIAASTLWVAVPTVLGLLGGGAVLGGSGLWQLLGDVHLLGPQLVVWIVLFGAASLSLVFVQVALQVVRTPGKGPGLIALVPAMVLYPMMMFLMQVGRDLDPPLLWFGSLLPVIGAPFSFLRYARGVLPVWGPVAHALVSVGVGLLLAAGVVTAGRMWSALGGWPRSVAEVRAALALQR